MNIDWGKIMLGLIASFVRPLLAKIVDWAIVMVEEWAYGLHEETGQKPSGEEKLEKAISLVRVMDPHIEAMQAENLIEAKLANEKVSAGKTANA